MWTLYFLHFCIMGHIRFLLWMRSWRTFYRNIQTRFTQGLARGTGDWLCWCWVFLWTGPFGGFWELGWVRWDLVGFLGWHVLAHWRLLHLFSILICWSFYCRGRRGWGLMNFESFLNAFYYCLCSCVLWNCVSEHFLDVTYCVLNALNYFIS